MSHWRDIVVKQHADIEEQVRISSRRYNLARTYVNNSVYYTEIGQADVNHRFRSAIYNFQQGATTGVITSSTDITLVGSAQITSHNNINVDEKNNTHIENKDFYFYYRLLDI